MSTDKIMKIFSADGRIYQMENAFKAINMFGMTAVAVKGDDSVVVCCQKKVPDKLVVPSSVTNIFNINETLGCIVVGNLNDSRYIITWLR